MSSHNECPNCGYDFASNDRVCPYCGTSNPLYVAPATQAPVANPTPSYVPPTQQKKKEQGVNWVIFILLLIFIWPAAIVYLLVCLDK